jgi:hypothetical protein
MKKVFWGTVLSALVIAISIPMMARAEVNVSISLPSIVFAAPPALIVLPDTYVYVVPDMQEDIYFYDGWWWRHWEGGWYRSHYYDRGWGYYRTVPSFYFDVDPGWRGYYRDRNWYGHRWNYERIPHDRLQQNWKGWQRDRHWEKTGTWGVQDYKPRPQQQRQELRQQRQKQYEQRPEVQKHSERQVQQPKQQSQERVQEKQRQEKQRQEKQRQEQQPQVHQPQSRETGNPQHREAGPQSREADKPQHRDASPQHEDGRQEHSQQQQGSHEMGGAGNQDRR